jgi:mutator protein MutT
MIKGCGGIVLKNGHILLIKRKNAKRFDGIWSNPGGQVEKDESTENAVVRELLEEIGIKTRIKRFIFDYKDYEGETLVGVYSGYLVETEDEPKIKEENKIEDMKWFSLNNLPENVAPYTLEYIQRL